MYLSCTKGDLRLPSHGMPGFVLGINSQLVEIDSNRCLSRALRKLASSSIVVTVLSNDGYDEHGIITPDMVTIAMLLNDIPHVWHRLVANLELNSYN